MNEQRAGAGQTNTTRDADPPRDPDTVDVPLVPLAQFAAGLAELPSPQRVPALWDDQRRRWRRGERPAVEEYLRALPAPLGPEVLLDVIYGECVLRQEEGATPRAEDYAGRFPDHVVALRRQLQLHDALAESPSTNARAAAVTAPPVPPEPAALAGAGEIAGYRVVSLLDAGGQGQIFRGVHPTLGRDVVIKLGHAVVEPGVADALVQEGRILAELDDPGLARVYDLRLHEGRPCLVMEFVRGVNLEQHARRQRPTPQAAAALVARVARALAVVHARGVVHRDVKPRNILIDEAGNPRVIDFGLARVTDAWRPDAAAEVGVSGTVSYMAPEQARGEAVGPAADVFALGGVLFFLLTGRSPYTGKSFTELHAQASIGLWDRAALADARFPPRLRAVVEKAMTLEPAARFATAEDMAAELEAFARPPRSRPWLAIAAAVAAVAALVALAVWQPWRRDAGPTSGQSADQPPVVGDVKPRPESLQVRVGRPDGEGYIDLKECRSVWTKNDVRFEAVAPAGMYAALFLFDSEGNLKRLSAVDPAGEDRPLFHPQDPTEAVPILGRAGNEMVFLVARRSGPFDVDELRQLLAGPWEKLPADSVLRLTPAEVKVIASSRAVGTPKTRSDPEGAVKRKLDELRKELRVRADHFEGLAFSHRE